MLFDVRKVKTRFIFSLSVLVTQKLLNWPKTSLFLLFYSVLLCIFFAFTEYIPQLTDYSGNSYEKYII